MVSSLYHDRRSFDICGVDFVARLPYQLIDTACVETEFTTAYLSLGSNLGDRAGNLLLATRALIEASFIVHRLSGIYETEPVEVYSERTFLNMAAEIRVSNVSPTQMMARLLRIEYLLGRTGKNMKTPRTVDLDILFFGDVVMNTEFLMLPHPRVEHRRFVLKPLSKIAPNFVHPVLQKDISELLAECPDQGDVRRWHPNGSKIPSAADSLEIEI